MDRFKGLACTVALLMSHSAFSHGGGGSSEISIENDLASGIHLHLPVRIESTGEVVFGFEKPAGESHQQEEHEGEHNEEEHAAEAAFHIAPSIVLGADAISRIISKDSLEEKTSAASIKKSDGRSGFIHVKNTRLIIGAGLDLETHLNVPPFGAGLGLVYTKNQNVYSETHIRDLSEKKRTLKLPSGLADFREWRTDEKLIYLSAGSVIFNAGIGIDPIVHGGVIASATGTWIVKLQKMDDLTLNASVTSIKATSFGVEVEGVVVGVGAEKIKAVEKGLNFLVDLSSPEASAALREFYKGDFRSLQKLAERNTSVRLNSHSTGLTTGSGTNATFNLPFLFGAGVSKYKLQSFQHDQGEDEEHIYTGIVSREESTKGVWSNHKKEVEQFSTTLVEEKDSGETFYAANYKWHYEKDEVKAEVVRKKLQELAGKTGLVQLSSLKTEENNLGHFRISFDISLTEHDIFESINLLKNALRLKTLKLSIEKKIESAVTIGTVSTYCPALPHSDEILESPVTRCVAEMKSKTTLQLKKLSQLARETAKFIVSKNYKASTNTYSQLGAILVKNPFLLPEVLPVMEDADLSFSVAGEKVFQQTINLK